MIICNKDIESITSVNCAQPHSILGMHPYTKKNTQGLLVRAYLKDAQKCEVIDSSNLDGPYYKLRRVTEDGLFEGIIEGRIDFFKYLFFSEIDYKKFFFTFNSFIYVFGKFSFSKNEPNHSLILR